MSTIAGLPNSAGIVIGSGSQARFDYPRGMAVDSQGNVYVADTYSNTIRKVTSSGQVSLYAGSPTGTAGYQDGTVFTSTFNNPIDIAIDSDDNIYITDYNNGRIRLITPSGYVSTIAGSSNQSPADGQSVSALLYYPYGITVDSNKNIYFTEFESHLVRQINATGYVRTISGSPFQTGTVDGQNNAGRFYRPAGITYSTYTNSLYIANFGYNNIRVINSTGWVSTFAGSAAGSAGFADGLNKTALFSGPYDVTSDNNGNVYVADSGNNVIRVLTLSGNVSTIAGSRTSSVSNGVGLGASTAYPMGIVYDNLSGNIYVSEYNGQVIRKMSAPIAVQSSLTCSDMYDWYQYIPFVSQKGVPQLYSAFSATCTNQLCQHWADTYGIVPFLTNGTASNNTNLLKSYSRMNCDQYITVSIDECQNIYNKYGNVFSNTNALPSNLQNIASQCQTFQEQIATTSSTSSSSSSSTSTSSSSSRSSSSSTTSSSSSSISSQSGASSASTTSSSSTSSSSISSTTSTTSSSSSTITSRSSTSSASSKSSSSVAQVTTVIPNKNQAVSVASSATTNTTMATTTTSSSTKRTPTQTIAISGAQAAAQDNSQSAALTNAGIIGFVVGMIVFIAICAGIAYYVIRRRRNKAQTRPQKLPGVYNHYHFRTDEEAVSPTAILKDYERNKHETIIGHYFTGLNDQGKSSNEVQPMPVMDYSNRESGLVDYYQSNDRDTIVASNYKTATIVPPRRSQTSNNKN